MIPQNNNSSVLPFVPFCSISKQKYKNKSKSKNKKSRNTITSNNVSYNPPQQQLRVTFCAFLHQNLTMFSISKQKYKNKYKSEYKKKRKVELQEQVILVYHKYKQKLEYEPPGLQSALDSIYQNSKKLEFQRLFHKYFQNSEDISAKKKITQSKAK